MSEKNIRPKTTSYQTPFVFSVSVFVLNYLPKNEFTVKHGSDLCNFYSKVMFRVFL